MDKKTVEQKSGRKEQTDPDEGNRPSSGTSAERGTITKGSSGKANYTTSTNFPEKPVPEGFLHKLAEMHTAERELTLALPLIEKAAESKDLKTLLGIHLEETRGHLKTIDAVAESLGVKLPSGGCPTMTELIAEGVKVIGKRLVSSEQDAALIAVGEKIEQFEIGAYTELCSQAEERNYAHELALLTSILNQEKLASRLLSGLAKGEAPLKELIEKASLEKAGATKHSS